MDWFLCDNGPRHERVDKSRFNIHNRNTLFLYNSFYQNSTLKKVGLYFLDVGGRSYCAVYVCSNDCRKPDKLLWWTMLVHCTVLKIKRTYWNGSSYWIEEVILKFQCLQTFAPITLLQVIDLISALVQPFICKCFTSPWVLFTFFKLHKWYQIAQGVSFI